MQDGTQRTDGRTDPTHRALTRASVRGAAGIGLPLLGGLLSGHRTFGMLMALGALWAVSQDGTDALRTRLPRMVAIALTSAVGFVAGAAVFRGLGSGAPVWILLAACGAVAGALEIGGPTAGAASLHLLLGAIVASGLPLPGPVWAPGAVLLLGALWVVMLALVPGTPLALAHAGAPPTGRTHPGSLERIRSGVQLAALVTGAAVLASTLGGRREYWLPLAVAFIFRPTLGPVSARAVARTAGTATGAAIAAIVATLVPGPAAGTALAAVCGALMPWAARRGYGPMCAAFTPVVFTLLDMAGDNHGLFVTRALDTAIGAGIVMLADLALRAATADRPRPRLSRA